MEIKKKIVELDLNDVLPNRFQPRIKFDEGKLEELSNSIKQHGVIQPIIVRRLGDKFEIIAGERRYKASGMADMKTIPAIVTEMNDKESSEIALIENVQRSDLTPIEEAISYKKVLDMNFFTQEELAVKLGKTQSTVANKLRLLHLDDDVQEALLEMKISERHARSLLKLKDVSKQKEMLNRIINERLTVRKTDEEIDNMLKDNEIEFLSLGGENQTANMSNLEMPSIDIVENEEETAPVVENNDMMFNQATMDIPGLVGAPSNPLVDSSVDYSSPIPSMLEEEVNEAPTDESINPGFMNIDDIENNAKDLFVEKPVRPLTSFLEPETPTEESEVVIGASNNILEEPKSSFINLNPQLVAEQEAADVNESEEVVAPAPAAGEMFDFNFEEVNNMVKPEVKVPELSGLSSLKPKEIAVEPTQTVVSESASDPIISQEIENVGNADETIANDVSNFVENASIEVESDEISAENINENTNSEFLQISEESSAPIEETLVEEIVVPAEEEIETLSLTGEMPVITSEVEAEFADSNAVEKSNDAPITPEVAEVPVTNVNLEMPTFAEPVPIDPIPVDIPILPEDEPIPVENPAILEEPKKEEKKGGFFDLFKKHNEPIEPVSPVSEVVEDGTLSKPIVEDAPIGESGKEEIAEPIVEEVELLSLTGEMPVITPEVEAAVSEVSSEMPILDEAFNVAPIMVEAAVSENKIDLPLATEETVEVSPIVEELASNPEPTNMFDGNVEPISEEVITPVLETIEALPSYDLPIENVLDSVEIPEEPKIVLTDEAVGQTTNIEVLDNIVPVEETSEDESDAPEFTPVEIATLPIEEAEALTIDDIAAGAAVAGEIKTAHGSMADAMRVIRDCTSQLNQLGFVTDTEEFDFENVYQVILKITKK